MSIDISMNIRKNSMKKVTKIFITIIMIAGISLSSVPYYVVSSIIDSYVQTRDIVDKAWRAQQSDGDVVDKFSTLKSFVDKFKTYEAMAAISYNSNGAFAYSASGGTSVSPAYPTSIAANDLLILTIGMKPSTANGGSVTTPGGWTPITSLTGAGGYGATLGADTGNSNKCDYAGSIFRRGIFAIRHYIWYSHRNWGS